MKWEYKSVKREPKFEDIDFSLNKLGEDGWELVTVNDNGFLIFKREKK